MIELYLAALAFGGTLLAASLILGAKHHDHDGGTADDGSFDVMAWVPVTSLRFWTFFLGFGGAVGATLTALGSAGPVAIAIVAGVVGWVTGAAAVATLRALRTRAVDSTTSAGELAGATAEVLVAVARGEVGKVRVEAKGRQQDFLAETDDDAPLPAGSRVFVVGPAAEGRVAVTKELA